MATDYIDFQIIMSLKKRSMELKTNLLPDKSKDRYLAVKKDFEAWIEKGNVDEVTEDATLVYLSERSEKTAP